MTPEDEAAFEAFVLATGPELVRFARRLTLDHHRGEDLVQEVLARFGTSWTSVSRAHDLRAYAYQAVVNEFLSWRRRRWWGERPAADVGDRSAVPGPDDDVLADTAFRDALAGLPPAQRAVLVLRYHLDLPDAAIAATMGCRESTVRSHARRALAALRPDPRLTTGRRAR
ncbi:RNA polymerase sigma factor [Pseudonocardia sp. CA-107938]|uniref:RNA polymerase sigma factor n=1 Tax=Pseudonocardia sp. CA-107938 TaxID=3240021 RepID=UPI003D94E59E